MQPFMLDDIRRRPLRLRLYPDAVLREVARSVSKCDHDTAALAGDMLALMRSHDGIGLAAPQVGLRVRLIVADIGAESLAVVNPRVSPISDEADRLSEGCLSLPGIHVAVERMLRVELRGLDPSGNPLHQEVRGLMARVIQHEVDHLNGVLICDYIPQPEHPETSGIRKGRDEEK